MRRMSHLGFLFLSFLFLSGAALPSSAGAAEVEITPFVGYRAGAIEFNRDQIVCAQAISVFCPLSAEAEDGETFGVIVDVALSENWMLELLVDHQETKIQDGFGNLLIFVPPRDLDWTFYQVGAQRRWVGERWTPFVGASAGVARVSSLILDRNVSQLGSTVRPAASVSGGVKLGLGEHWGLRFEGRVYGTGLSEALGGELVQSQVSSGVTFRW